MSAFLDLLRSRRSIRRYTEEPVAPEHRDLLEEALLRAPTSRNREHWTFVVVDDRAALHALAHAKPHGSSFLARAPLAVAICGDSAGTDVWIEDCSIAAILVQLAAHDLGLGSCWVQIRGRHHAEGHAAEEHVRAVLELPQELSVLAVVAIGHPDETRPGRDAATLRRDAIHRGRYRVRPTI